MSNDTMNENHGGYVRRIRADTQRYVEDLLGENEKLRRMVAGLESEAAVLTREKKRLVTQLEAVRKLVDCDRNEHQQLRQRLVDIEDQNRSFSERYVEVEQQNNDLANLYVAGYRLHGTLNRQEVLEAIQEIIINLIGCEEFAVFEAAAEGAGLGLVTSFGLDEDRLRRLSPEEGVVSRVYRDGETVLAERCDAAERHPEESDLTACIPLKIDQQVIGVIAIFRLLPQKIDGLQALDHELFDLLAAQAGVALYSTRLHASVAIEPLPPADTEAVALPRQLSSSLARHYSPAAHLARSGTTWQGLAPTSWFAGDRLESRDLSHLVTLVGLAVGPSPR